MAKKKKLRVGFIGTGGIGRHHMKYLAGYPDVEVVAGADTSEAALKAERKDHGLARTYTSYQKMLKEEKLDAVSVCTPNGLHAKPSIAALRAGCHVLVEKPLAMNAREGQAMVAAARKARRKLVIGFLWRYHPKAQFLREAVAKGLFGKILYMRCSALRRRGIPNWGVFGRKDLQGGGPLIDIGVHIMEMAHYVMGEPKPVAASGHAFRYIGDKKCSVTCPWENWDHKTYTVEDLAVGQIRFANGAVMQVEASFAAHVKDTWNFSFMGEKGGADFDNLSIHTDEDGYMVDKTPAWLPNYDYFERKMRAFVETALYNKPTESPAEAGLVIQKIIDGIYKSADTGKEVPIR
jgi:predicted dehydrogenase